MIGSIWPHKSDVVDQSKSFVRLQMPPNPGRPFNFFLRSNNTTTLPRVQTQQQQSKSQTLKMPSIRLLPPSTLRLLRASSAAPTSPSPAALIRTYSSAFQNAPAPPRLPAEQQAEFERLQRAVADRFADPTPLPHEQPQTSPAATSRHVSTSGGGGEAPVKAQAEEVATGGVWRGAPPEFDGEKNPKTGEVGGPKTEPLRWGSAGDWSYNGRVTDF